MRSNNSPGIDPAKASPRWVTLQDITVARQDIRRQFIRQLPRAIVQCMMTGVAVLAGLVLLAWLVLDPQSYPGGLLKTGTAIGVLVFFATPIPLLEKLGTYGDQRYELKRVEKRLRSGEAIPMPAGGVLAIPPLPHPDME